MKAAPLAALLLAAAGAVAVAAGATAPVELRGLAVLPADTFAGGPPSGASDDPGARAPAPRFAAQPVQGVSSIQPGPRAGTWWALSDNGYALRWNSYDYRLALYLFALLPRTRADDPRAADAAGRVRLLRRIALRDPRRVFPWRLTEESLRDRPLTGADADPESLVAMPDGTFWIGDEVGPWLLHVSARGELLEPPVELEVALDGGERQAIRSAVHPLVLAGKARAQLRNSKGFEGLALGPTPGTLLAMLEGPLPGDPPDVVRVLEFDLARRAWTGRSWRYRLDDPRQMISELVPAGGGAYLVIERDDTQGEAARFKRIFRIDLAAADDAGVLRKTLLVDLLDLADPLHLGGTSGHFRYPYWCTEAAWLLAPHELLVVDDNNFPATGGRSATLRDPTEWIWLRLP
ncbi:MAG: esterase-like activity of phytase family protein [Steroidobacteraceae bacterium]